MSNIKTSTIISFNKLGWVEMLIALMPILGAYYLGSAPFSFWILLFLSIVSILFKKKKIDFSLLRPFLIFILYYLVHEVILFIVADSINVNKRIESSVFLISVLFVVPIIDYKKLVASLNLVSLICILGLIYQLIVIMTGGVVHPIEIPGLEMSEDRLAQLSMRPSSFFMEPAAYTAYMYAPLMLSLINRNYWWSAILVVSMLLTSSTTAIFAVFIILGVYVINQGLFKRRSFIVIFMAALLLYGFTHLSIFNVGMDKLQDTDFETNVRIQQGPVVVSTMHWNELIAGVRYSGTDDYYLAGRTFGKDVAVYGQTIYMSTFWLLIFSFGIIGLLLYLNIFYRLLKRNRVLAPYIICLLVTMFTASMGISVSYVYTMIVLYVIAAQYKQQEQSNRLTIK